MNSILTSIKLMLGITEDYKHFDTQILIHINSVFLSLTQIGIGPKDGFLITSEMETWDQFINGANNIEAVKTYIYLKVKLLFDPPDRSVIDAMNRQISELEWRLNVQAEST